MKVFIDKIMESYTKHEHLKDAIEYDIGISDSALTKMGSTDFEQIIHS